MFNVLKGKTNNEREATGRLIKTYLRLAFDETVFERPFCYWVGGKGECVPICVLIKKCGADIECGSLDVFKDGYLQTGGAVLFVAF